MEASKIWTERLEWNRGDPVINAESLELYVNSAKSSGVKLVVVEVLGKVRGQAKGRYQAWAAMSRTAGMAIQECRRQGLEVVEMDPGDWRGLLGLPVSFGDGKEKDELAKSYAKEGLGLVGVSAHECEAALIALAGARVLVGRAR